MSLTQRPSDGQLAKNKSEQSALDGGVCLNIEVLSSNLKDLECFWNNAFLFQQD